MHDLDQGHPLREHARLLDRRRFLAHTGMGLGLPAMASLLPGQDDRPRALTHAPRAKRVIWLFMAGAPSQLDTFDHKPDLAKRFAEPLPPSVSKGQRVTAMTRGREQRVAPSMYRFEPRGSNGVHWCELFPHLSRQADDICVVRSLHTNAINHDPGKTSLCTGSELPGKPSMGAWLSYGLGSMNRDLPDFVILTSAYWTGGKRNVQGLYSRMWGSGFLPTKHQGVALQSTGDPVLFLSNPDGLDRSVRRRMLDAVGELNAHHAESIGDPEIQTTIAQQEMAFRMQASVPEATDLSAEPAAVRELYGPEVEKTGSFARNCLLARRLIERDVRFVQIFHRGWDQHFNVAGDLPNQCRDIDQPSWALVQDLKQRGLLDDTLVHWGGEFGRTVYCQGKLTRENYGRDHHPRCFTTWLAGGGIRGGVVHGETDDFSYNVVRDPVHIRDLNATMLHCLGLDHERLSIKHQGLDVRLTSVEPARVVGELLA